VAVSRFVADRRARVPFALVGVVLLVGAATFGAAISTRGPDRVDRDADVAMERTAAETTAAVRSAVGDAARAAAAEPVTSPAETPYGRILNPNRPFRDALRLRIYLAVHDRLSVTRYRRNDVTAVASLPEATTPAELRRAIDRIELRGVENGTALRVTIRNVTVTAREAGRVVARERRPRTVTVATPVLALHERTRTFETRLNRGPLEGPGLGRRLTARLYPIAWARGWGQYSGLPIANVVATRHVETSTNGAVLETQRAVFGRSDPAGRRAMRRARLEFGVKEVSAATPIDGSRASRLLPRPNPNTSESEGLALSGGRTTSGASQSRRMTVDVAPLSDQALAGLRSETLRSNRSLRGVLRRAYRVEAELRTTRRLTYGEPRPEPEPPSEEWSLDETTVSTAATVESSIGSTPSVGPEERRFGGFARHVALNRTVTWTWSRGNDTRTTSGTWTERYRVGVTLLGTYAPNGTAPNRPTRPRFERGGPVDGPNLVDVPAKARRHLVERQGGPDAVAVAVANRSLDISERAVYGDRPDALRPWTNGDLKGLRNRLANVSVSIPAGAVATYAVNPPRKLATELRRQRSALIDAPERYRGAADRARVGARVALLDATIRRLERRAASHAATREAFDTALGSVGLTSTKQLHDIQQQRWMPVPPRRGTLNGSPPGGAVGVVPDGSPAYLTVASVGHGRAPGVPPSRSYHPLSAKNVNLFAVPYGDAADTVTNSGLDHAPGVRLRTAARVLTVSPPTSNTSVQKARRPLRESVSESVDLIRTRATRVVRNETALTRHEARGAVAEGIGRWDRPGRRALAASNGSLAAAIATAADERAPGRSPERATRLETQLDAAITDVRRKPAATVGEQLVQEALTRVRDRAVDRATTAAATRLNRSRLAKRLGGLPTGLPVAPVPGYWYATTNVWEIHVRGAYARFTLRTRRGAPPSAPGGALRYVRDGSTVRLDVDGDGEPEQLGRDERVAFETKTVVAVAVPAGPRGVGDVDGNADERAGTWPQPRCTSWEQEACPSSE